MANGITLRADVINYYGVLEDMVVGQQLVRLGFTAAHLAGQQPLLLGLGGRDGALVGQTAI